MDQAEMREEMKGKDTNRLSPTLSSMKYFPDYEREDTEEENKKKYKKIRAQRLSVTS